MKSENQCCWMTKRAQKLKSLLLNFAKKNWVENWHQKTLSVLFTICSKTLRLPTYQ